MSLCIYQLCYHLNNEGKGNLILNLTTPSGTDGGEDSDLRTRAIPGLERRSRVGIVGEGGREFDWQFDDPKGVPIFGPGTRSFMGLFW